MPNLRTSTLPLRVATTTVAVAILLATGVTSATTAAAVTYCPEYHHYGRCTTMEMYAINVRYYQRLYDAVTASIKAMQDALRGIVRRG